MEVVFFGRRFRSGEKVGEMSDQNSNNLIDWNQFPPLECVKRAVRTSKLITDNLDRIPTSFSRTASSPAPAPPTLGYSTLISSYAV